MTLSALLCAASTGAACCFTNGVTVINFINDPITRASLQWSFSNSLLRSPINRLSTVSHRELSKFAPLDFGSSLCCDDDDDDDDGDGEGDGGDGAGENRSLALYFTLSSPTAALA